MNMKDNLLITSIGDNTVFHKSWYCDIKFRNYDIIFLYYGSEPYSILNEYCDIFIKSKGSKINNIMSNMSRINFDNYKYIFMIDDDINICHNNINKLFHICNKMNVNIASPSHSSYGKISHDIMKCKNNSYIRSTNFVEITCPIFCKEAFLNLFKYLKNKDTLYEYGIDYVMSYLFFIVAFPPTALTLPRL